jgi:glycine cleavage system aminomethyltransferase T
MPLVYGNGLAIFSTSMWLCHTAEEPGQTQAKYLELAKVELEGQFCRCAHRRCAGRADRGFANRLCGELGYAIWCHRRDAEKVFNAVWKAGEPDGLKPMLVAALDTARIEGGLIFVGYEFFDQSDPFEAGIGFTMRLKTKTDDSSAAKR